MLLLDRGELPLKELYPTGAMAVTRMFEKGWVDLVGSAMYRITSAGKAALRAELPTGDRKR